MRKLIEHFFVWAGSLFLAAQSAQAFSLAGPIGNAGDAWQIADIGYGWHDPDAPKDIYEEYRPVTPVMYYACDASFLSYYGASGLTNVDAAFAILNGVMCGQTNTSLYLFSPTNGITLSANGMPGGTPMNISASDTLDSYSGALLGFPLNSQQNNYTAQSLGLWDMKSFVLHEAVVHLGLEDPDRYVWTLHDRLPNPLGLDNPRCPQDVEYIVVQRNFDTSPGVDYPYSSYINGNLYTFYIAENCGSHPGGVPWSAITETSAADSGGDYYSAVASGGVLGGDLPAGAYYTALTRDDVMGLKYLLSTNNINWEQPSAVSQLATITTNFAPQPFPPAGTTNAFNTTNSIGYYYFSGDTNGAGFGYGNLSSLLAFSTTNDPAKLVAAYPGIVVANVSTNWLWASNETYSYSYTLPAGSAYGTAPTLTIKTNYIGYYQAHYLYQFENVFTNHYYTNQAKLVTEVVGPPAGSTYGSPSVTNISVTLTNQIEGDFFVQPVFYTGVCPVDIVDSSHFNVLAFTNYLTVADTNLLVSTNSITNSVSFSNTKYLVTYFTNYTYLINPVTCTTTATNTPALRRGIGRVQFIRANYDALLGQTFQPITNYYTMVKIDTNSQPVLEHYQRVVTEPDFLFQSRDLTVPDADFPYGPASRVEWPNNQFQSATNSSQLAGPGIINPLGTIIFNKNLNDMYVNGSLSSKNLSTNSFLDASTQDKYGAWGAFDGTTNYPIVYPSSSDIASLMNQVVIQVTPATVPDGTNGVPYNGGVGVTFTATGGQPGYTWASPGLAVPGLTFNASTETLSGTPTAAGTYTIPIRVTDSGNRVINLNYPITIH